MLDEVARKNIIRTAKNSGGGSWCPMLCSPVGVKMAYVKSHVSNDIFPNLLMLFLLLCLTGLQASGLKKNIFGKPSPYVKLSIMPSRRHLRSWKQHHGQIAKTSSQTNTINPKWNSEVSEHLSSYRYFALHYKYRVYM